MSFERYWLLNLRPDLGLQQFVECGVPSLQQVVGFDNEGDHFPDTFSISRSACQVISGVLKVVARDCSVNMVQGLFHLIV